MIHYMLDTNMVSHIVKMHPIAIQHLLNVPITSLCISSITHAELLFGLAKHPTAHKLHAMINEFLSRVDILAWGSTAAKYYGTLRAKMETQGKILSSLDLLIASHAQSEGTILVTNDKAFGQIESLTIEDWTISSK